MRESGMSTQPLIPGGVRRIFAEGFRVADVAEPLASFDEATPAADVGRFMSGANFDVVGVRRDGQVWGFVERLLPETGPCGVAATPLDVSAVLPDSAPLSAAVSVLATAPRAFVTVFGRVAGIVTRADVQKPPVRMWLFGMVTLIELRYARLIEQFCPDESWRQYLSEGRLKKAEVLLAERRRRHQDLTLFDCLQLSDKGQIVARNEQIRRLTIYPSRGQAEEGVKMLEGLRNSLAHAQDIVACDWEAIVRLSDHLDRVMKGEVVLPPEEPEGAARPSPGARHTAGGPDRGGSR
jgi:CBS domain-containing protein